MILDRYTGWTAKDLKRDEAALISVLTDAGTMFKGKACRCVFCDDRHPSAGIYNGDGHYRYKCHKCGFMGDILDIMAKLDGIAIEEVFKRLKGGPSQPSGASKVSGVPKGQGTGDRPNPAQPGPSTGIPGDITGASRSQPKIYPDIAALKQAMPSPVEAAYKYTEPNTGKIEMLVLRLKTPDGKTFRQCRPVSGGFIQAAPAKPWSLYNRKRIQAADTVVVVEGESCVYSLHEYGVIATTSPGGALKAEYADWTPLAGKNIVLWPDNDPVDQKLGYSPGRKHMQQVESILQSLEPKPQISVIEPTDLDLNEKEDCVDFIRQLEVVHADKTASNTEIQKEIHKALSTAKPRGVASGLSELIEDTISGKRKAIEWPWLSISRLTKALLPGTVTIICGGVGASKSFMLLQAGAYWYRHGIKVAIYELEESRDFHLSRCLAQLSKTSDMTDPDWIKENPEQARALFKEHESFLDSFGACIYASPDTQPTLTQLANWVQDRAKAGCRVIAIDPVTAAAHTGRATWEEDNTFLHSIKRTAVDYHCSVVLITHPIKTVSLADITQLAGGAAYSRFAQTILWLESYAKKTNSVKTACGTAEEEHNRTLHLLKVRNGKGQGLRLAYNFEVEGLTLSESGVILRKKGK